MSDRPLLVLGSMNVDLFARVHRLPGAGETVGGAELTRRFGGKGANQALAAALQGATVRMLGCVGSDGEGRAYREHLRRAGVDDSLVLSAAGHPTGTAFITLDKHGENQIVVVPGANGAVSEQQVLAASAEIAAAGALLAQWEVPTPAMAAAFTIAARQRVPVIFNPSPLQTDFPWGRWSLAALIVNETEALQLCGTSEPAAWAAARARLGVETLIVTRGAASTWVCAGEGSFEVPTLKVAPLDTVGAGDAFAGTFAARRCEGASLRSAVAAANCAGALATQAIGAQESLPSRGAVEEALRSLSL